MSGVWEERGVAADYLKKGSVHCEFCGRMIVRLGWVVESQVFCDPDCARLYRSYWLPRYGKT